MHRFTFAAEDDSESAGYYKETGSDTAADQLKETVKEAVLERIRAVYDSSYLSSMDDHRSDEIRMDTDIRRSLGFDSIILVVLQIDLEDRFHIKFDPVRDDLGMVFTSAETIGEYIIDHSAE